MNEAIKLPFELWEYSISTGTTKRHSAFEKRGDAEKMKRSLEARTRNSVYTIAVDYTNHRR